MAFAVRRGVNISHWLSQSGRRGEERRTFFQRPDVDRLAEIGFDHLRIPVDEEHLWSAEGAPLDEAFDLLNGALDWCEECGLRAIVDMHILRSHHFNEGEKPLFTDASSLERFLTCWEDVSSRLVRRSVDRVAYELLNEPVAEAPQDWNRVAKCALDAIRELEPERYVVLGSNRWNSAGTFDVLQIPDDKRLILTFHFYEPLFLTHYRASWTSISDYAGPVHYPGKGIARDDLANAPESVRDRVAKTRNFSCRAALAQLMEKPLAVQKRTGLPLYCGEWGCILLAPRPDRLRWYADVRRILEDNGIAWAIWDRRGSFGIEDANGACDEELVRTLLA
jgi:endoglucanase